MTKSAFLFPGQGAQTIGMGLELYENNEIYKKSFDQIDASLDIDLKSACFKGENMDKSEYVQPAIYAHSVCIKKALDKDADIFAGLSLGEYSALACSGVINITEGAKLVNIRGKIMDEAVPADVGSMISLIGPDIETVEKLLRNTSDVWIANHLSKNQIVIAGKKDALEKIEPVFSDIGARTTFLNVSGPFHTQMLNEASEKFRKLLDAVKFNDMNKTVYANYTGTAYKSRKDIPEFLAKQMCSRVKWHDIVENLLADGIDEFIELGPSMVLSKMLKRRTKGMDIRITSIRDLKSFNKYLDK